MRGYFSPLSARIHLLPPTNGLTATPQSGVTYSAAAGALLFDGTSSAYVQLTPHNPTDPGVVASNVFFTYNEARLNGGGLYAPMTFIFSARIEAAASQAAVPLLAFGGATGTGGSVTPPAGGSGGSCSSTFLGQSELYVTTNANWSPSGGADITYQQCPQTSGGAGTLTLTSAGGGTPTGLAQSTWAQIALVYSGNVAQGASAALTIFVNGVQVATTTTAVFPPTSTVRARL